MVKIRLARTGTNKVTSYRIVVTDHRAKRDGRHIENLGTYDPRAKQGGFVLDHARLKHWLGFGAQLSEEMTQLLKRNPAPQG
jgi:small subunit ribosomal protein S16